MMPGDHRCRLVSVSAALLLLAGCTPPKLPDLKPGEEPDPTTPEAGLWLRMDEAESKLANSGEIVEDPALTDYLHGITCRLAPDYCEDIRVYVLAAPDFQATMAPNGVLTVWSGLLLRAEDEAQVASVLGHEIGHYIRRHSLSRWIAARDTADATAFISLGAAVGGVGAAGSVVQLMAIGHVKAFTREQEREADRYGFDLMATADYDPDAAAEVWRNLIDEREAADAEEPFIFFASHPPSDERMERLREKASKLSDAGERRKAERLERHIAPHERAWLRQEIATRRHERNLVLLDRLANRKPDDPLIPFFRGEVYRLRRAEGDLQRAQQALARAAARPGAPPAAHRSLGVVSMHMDDERAARRAFNQYLKEKPQAEDRAMIESHLEGIR